MGKYDPLGKFLRAQRTSAIPMTFAQIESILGFKLPQSAHQYRAWWSNNGSRHVMTQVWCDAGFRSEQVDIEERKLVFRRIEKSFTSDASARPDDDAKNRSLIGWMKGTVHIPEGVDITEPADPDWGKAAWGEAD